MNEEMLSDLEREARGKSWRVSFLRNGIADMMPESGGILLRAARAKEKRIRAIAVALGITNIMVVSTLSGPVPGVPPPIRHKSRLRSIAENEGIDLDILVNPEALEGLVSDIVVIR